MNELSAINTEVKDMTPDQLGGEIRLLTSQARRMALSYAIQIGYRLKIAHEKVGPHGWAEWLKKETDFSPAAASRFQKLYEGYGEDQGSLFGVGNKFPTLEKMSVSNALRLLAVPEEEREEVAAELGAEDLSARELEKALAERDEARKALEKAERAAKVAEEDRDAAEKAAEELSDDLDKAQQRVKELESRPVEIAVERDEEAIRKAAEDARKAAEEAGKAERDKLLAKLDKAEKAKKKAEEEAKRAAEGVGPYKEKIAQAEAETEELRRKLRAAESGAGEVAMLARQAQVNFSAAMDKIEAMQSTHPGVAEAMLTGMTRIAESLANRIKVVRG